MSFKSQVRQKLPFAVSAYHWAVQFRRRTMLRLRSRESVFTDRYRGGGWTSEGSLSGAGSDEGQTRAIRAELPRLIARVGASSFLDIPCGDFNWMKDVDLGGVRYIGADIVPDIVAENRRLYAGPGREFVQLDLIKDALPAVDIVFCRDCLVHLSEAEVHAAIRNIAASGSRYLLTTTFVDCAENEDIVTGEWRRLNFRRPPFEFPEPVELVDEQCTEAGGRYADKSLGLWRIADLPG